MKNWIYTLILFLAVGTASCFDDDSTLGTHTVGEIEIGALKDTSLISYNGIVLRVLPDVKVGYSEDEMTYAWYLWDGKKEEGFRANPIGDTKELNYEVNLPTGEYTIIFEAKVAATSYAQTATFKLRTSTPFSTGFYILKETEGGQTDVDLLRKDGQLVENVIENVTGASLAGKPVNMAMVYDNGYINDETLDMAQDNMLYVFTDQDFRSFRTEDMKQVFGKDNLLFSPDAEEKFYTMVYDQNNMYAISNRGLYRAAASSSGKYGFPEIEGGSKYVFCNPGWALSSTIFFWNESTHGISVYEGGVDVTDDWGYELPAKMKADDLECMACGYYSDLAGFGMSNKGWFLCSDRSSGKRLLLVVDFMFYAVDVRELDANLHLAKADIVTGNWQAPVIYALDGGKLYRYDLDLGEELPQPFELSGIEGEITYITNSFCNLTLLQYDPEYGVYFPNPSLENYDYLIVATRSGSGYKVYYYDTLVGGVPEGSAKLLVTGTSGELKSVRFLSATYNSEAWSYAGFYGPIFPCYD